MLPHLSASELDFATKLIGLVTALISFALLKKSGAVRTNIKKA
jgi:hypothetical protein